MFGAARCIALFVVGTVFVSSVSIAQDQARPDQYTAPMKPAQPFVWVGGLYPVVTSFTQDSAGYMWVGTQKGLFRLDGDKQTEFAHDNANTASISSSWVKALVADREGKVWVGTDKGIDIVEAGVVRQVVADYAVSALAVTEKGVLVGTQDNGAHAGLHFLATGAKEPTAIDLPGAERSTINAIAVAASGDIWVTTEQAGLYRLSEKGGKLVVSKRYTGKEGFPSDSVTALLVHNKLLYVGTTDKGLVELDPATGKTRVFGSVASDRFTLTDLSVSAIVPGEDKTLWVGTGNGLNLLNLETKKAIRYDSDYNDLRALPYNAVTSAFVDNAGVRWFGTDGGRACKYDPVRAPFEVHQTAVGGGQGMYVDKDGTWWIGSGPGLLSHYDVSRQTVTVYNRLGEGEDKFDLRPYWVTGVWRDTSGALWMTLFQQKGGGALVRFVPDTNEVTVSLEGTMALHLHPSKRGGFYVSTIYGEGVLYVDPLKQTIEPVGGIGSKNIFVTFEDRKDPNTLWVGSGDAGLFKVNLDLGTAESFQHDPKKGDSISSDSITSIHQEPSGELWVGTEESGLNRLDPKTGTFERFTTKDGLPGNDIVAIYGDKKGGTLWIGTDGDGLVRYQIKDKKFTTFGASHGSLINLVRSAHYQSESGLLFFGDSSRFMVFDPTKVITDTFAPPVVFTSLNVVGEPVGLGASEYSLGYKQTALSFEFAALSYGAPKSNRYSYKLDGYDSDWVESLDGRANYTNLDPGEYRFRARATNRDGVPSENEITMALSIASPPWFSWWAFLIYGVTALGLGFAYWRYQQQKLERVRTEKKLETVEQEMALSAAVQNGYIPEGTVHRHGDVLLRGFWRSADACSGDWWVYEKDANGNVIVVVADVTGHGAGPAMVTAAAGTAFRVTQGLTFEERMEILNKEILAVGQRDYHMTMAAVVVTPGSGEYKYYSAGSPPLIVLPAGSRSKPLYARGTPLGSTQFQPAMVEGQLEPNSRLLLCTDGIPETADADGKLIGMRRFSKMCEGVAEVGLDAAVTRLVDESDKIRDGRLQDDDWTFVMVERAS